MELSNQNQEIIIFAKQLADSNLEPGQYDLIMKEYIRLHKNQKVEKRNSISFLEWLALIASVFGTIFLWLFMKTFSGSPILYLIATCSYFIIVGFILFKGKVWRN